MSRAVVLALMLAGAAPGQVMAQNPNIECNADGYVLQPITGYRAIETIYLGKTCDAYSDAYRSDGRWCWANSGILVNYSNGQQFNMRIELPFCEQIAASINRCQCN